MRAHPKSAITAAFLLLFVSGCRHAPPVILLTVASPPAVYPGDPVTVTATAVSVDTNKKNNLVYSWSGTGVKGSGTTSIVDTTALAPGNYTVKAEVKEGKKGKEGRKLGQTAEASASFTVKAFEPPTISCSASPSYINLGESSTVTAGGVSPQNRPLTYSYSADGGTISGNGATATYSSTGAPTGMVGITCTATDDKSQTATANTSVTIRAPYSAPMPHSQTLGSIDFSKCKHHPTRVDNEALAVLDGIALDLKYQQDANLVTVGEASLAEKMTETGNPTNGIKEFAAQRAVNVKDYLVKEKGIDASRISVRTGTADEQNVKNYLVPTGANFEADVPGTTPVNETVVKPEPRDSTGKGNEFCQGGRSEVNQTTIGGSVTLSNPTNCKGFAIFTYPSPMDLRSKGNRDKFYLYVVKFTSSDQVLNSAANQVCSEISEPTGCIDISQWKNDCAANAQLHLPVPGADSGNKIKAWSISKDIQVPLNVELQNLPDGVEFESENKQCWCQPKTIDNTYAEFIWQLKVNGPQYTERNDPLHLQLYDNNGYLVEGVDPFEKINLDFKFPAWWQRFVGLMDGIWEHKWFVALCSAVIAGGWKKRAWIVSRIKTLLG